MPPDEVRRGLSQKMTTLDGINTEEVVHHQLRELIGKGFEAWIGTYSVSRG